LIIAIVGIWRRHRHSGCRWVHPTIYYHYYYAICIWYAPTYIPVHALDYTHTYTRIIYYNFEKKLSDLFLQGATIHRESDSGVAVAVLPVSAVHNTFKTGFSYKNALPDEVTVRFYFVTFLWFISIATELYECAVNDHRNVCTYYI